MADDSLPPGFQLDQTQPALAAQPGPQPAASAPPQGFQLDEDTYGTPGQQLAAGLEGVAKGVAGPLAPLAEIKSGLTTPEAIRGRAEANPWTHGLGEAAGFAGSALTGVGEGALVGELGEAAAPAGEAITRALTGVPTGPLSWGASTISKIASQGIKTGSEMAALQAGDETAKMITQDPGQSLGTAAINIGLAGVLGGVGGGALGAVSPLWKAGINEAGVPQIIDDAKAEYNFRQSLQNGGDVPGAVTDELTNRMNEVDNMRTQMGQLKGTSLARAMPDVTDENTAKINAQIEDISEQMTQNIEKASNNAYLKGAVPKLVQDFQDFLEVVTDPNATYGDKFDAIDDLKRAQQAKSNYNMTAEDTALGQFTKGTARDLRLKLEDPSVWGDAATVQQKVNAAISDSINAEKDAASKFTSKMGGDRVADPAKINTLINQSIKGKAGLKTDIMSNYLDQTENLANTINKIHTDAGLDAPISLTPAPATRYVVGAPASAGRTLGKWLFEKGLATAAGDTAAGAAGAGLGALVGHPAIGALIGERMLAPVFKSIAKPLLETASNAEGMKSAIDYVANVIRGEKTLSAATNNLFRAGAEILPKDMIPNVESRQKLQASLDAMKNTDTAMNVGGSLGHYLPSHQTAAGAVAGTAQQYFAALKPTQPTSGLLGKPLPVDPYKQRAYDRQLDIAQQPLMALVHAKKGTLQQQDVQTVSTLYPQLKAKIAQACFENMAEAKAGGYEPPYHQRQSLSMLIGQPLDGTLQQPNMMAIMAANAPKGPPKPPQGAPRKISKSTASLQEKTDNLYATPEQRRATAHATGGAS